MNFLGRITYATNPLRLAGSCFNGCTASSTTVHATSSYVWSFYASVSSSTMTGWSTYKSTNWTAVDSLIMPYVMGLATQYISISPDFFANQSLVRVPPKELLTCAPKSRSKANSFCFKIRVDQLL